MLYRDQEDRKFSSSMGNNTGELELKNKSVITDPLIGDVQFGPVATLEQRQFNGSGQTIERDILVYSAGRSISVSGCKLTIVKFC